MTEDLYLLVVVVANLVASGLNTFFALRNLDMARKNSTFAQENAATARANAETAERLVMIASKQGVVVLQRNR